MKFNFIRKKVPKKVTNLIFTYWLPACTALLFIGLLFISIFTLLYRTKAIRDEIIAQDVVRLTKILQKIDSECGISGFDYQKNNLDFLNVSKFEGSEIGPMNLKYPSSWAGPYVKDNPTIQNKAYQVVKTIDGYFVVPGEGVKLSDGKVIGKDIVFDRDAKISQMMNEGGSLYRDDHVVAVKLNLKHGMFSSFIDKTIEPERARIQSAKWF